MRIGDLARECGVNPKTIRYYEAFGLLPKPARVPSGHRTYSEKDLQRLRFVRRAKGIGLPLTSIRQITRYVDTGSCEHRHAHGRLHARRVRAARDPLGLCRSFRHPAQLGGVRDHHPTDR